MHHASPATSAGIMRMKRCGPLSWFTQSHLFLVFFAGLQHIGGRPPIARGDFGKIP